jgi:hypothetical protein
MEDLSQQSEKTLQGKSGEATPSKSLKPLTLTENETVYDECFVVRKSRYGLYNSFTLDGKPYVTSPDVEEAVYWTRDHLKREQDQATDSTVGETYDSTVGGKL